MKPAREIAPARVSAVIPTHNRPAELVKAIDSLLAQTYPHVEIVVVEDGATDATAAALAPYAGRLTFIQQPHRGVAAARNAGFQASTGEYLTFLDDDDWVLPDKISRQMQILHSQPDAGLVHCGYLHANAEGRFLSRTTLLPQGDVLSKLLHANFIWMGAPLIRRTCLDRVGLFDEQIPSVTADWDMWLRVALAGYSFACAQEPLGVYRIHEHSMMADVRRLEQGMLAVPAKVFSGEHLGNLAALRETVYGTIHYYVSRRYYAAGLREDGCRCLAEALNTCPRLIADRAGFFQILCDDALDARVPDPLGFIESMLEHLPPAARDIRTWQPYLLSRVHLGLGLRDYGLGRLAEGRQHLVAAFRLYPKLIEQPEDFVQTFVATAMHLPEMSEHYARAVLDNLPPELVSLKRVWKCVESDVSIGYAFEDWAAGRRRRAARRILSGLPRRPAWLLNRGVASILARSLPALFSRDGDEVTGSPDDACTTPPSPGSPRASASRSCQKFSRTGSHPQ